MRHGGRDVDRGANAVVAPYISLDDCTVEAQSQLRDPFQRADQMIDHD